MKKILCIGMLLTGLGLFLAPSVMALSIGFDPADQFVNVGESIAVDIVVSELGSDIVSAYDLDVLYDPEILDLTGVTFGKGLGGDMFFMPMTKEMLDLEVPSLSNKFRGISNNPIAFSLTSTYVQLPVPVSMPASIQYAAEETPGILDIREASLLSDSALESRQQGPFALASIFFDVIALGNSSLEISLDGINEIVGRNSEAFDKNDITLDGGKVAAVPEPATILLLGAGLAGLAGFRRKKFNRKTH